MQAPSSSNVPRTLCHSTRSRLSSQILRQWRWCSPDCVGPRMSFLRSLQRYRVCHPRPGRQLHNGTRPQGDTAHFESLLGHGSVDLQKGLLIFNAWDLEHCQAADGLGRHGVRDVGRMPDAVPNLLIEVIQTERQSFGQSAWVCKCCWRIVLFGRNAFRADYLGHTGGLLTVASLAPLLQRSHCLYILPNIRNCAPKRRGNTL